MATDERHLYFNELGGPIWRTDHAGVSVDKLADTDSYHMTADTTHVYWTTKTDIRRVAKTGGTIELVETLSAAPTQFGWMTLDEKYVYVSTYEGSTLVRAPKTGGPFAVVATSNTTMGGVAVMGDTMYWADYDRTGAVHQVDLVSNATRVLLPGMGTALRIAGEGLWFGADPDFNSWQKFLIRVPLGGGSPVRYSVPGHLIPYESDGLHMYWVFTDLMRIDLATGEQAVVASNVTTAHQASHLAFTADWIFVSSRSTPGSIVRLPKPRP